MDFKKLIAESLLQSIEAAGAAGALTATEIMDMLETPPNPDMGDFAFPCFKLAKVLRKAPPMIAASMRWQLRRLRAWRIISGLGFPT